MFNIVFSNSPNFPLFPSLDLTGRRCVLEVWESVRGFPPLQSTCHASGLIPSPLSKFFHLIKIFFRGVRDFLPISRPCVIAMVWLTVIPLGQIISQMSIRFVFFLILGQKFPLLRSGSSLSFSKHIVRSERSKGRLKCAVYTWLSCELVDEHLTNPSCVNFEQKENHGFWGQFSSDLT